MPEKIQPHTILIVEDEGIVAKDLQQTLNELGYDAYAIACSADEAMTRVLERRPDLTLMDIRIKGENDGVAVAQILHDRFDVPVIFLTAHADGITIERAKAAEPYGYLLKPIKSAELSSTIEIALFKHTVDKIRRESELWYATTLRSIGDAVIATDAAGLITFMNPAAESLTGWHLPEVKAGRPLPTLLREFATDAETGNGFFVKDPDEQLTRCSDDALPMARALRGEHVDQFNLLARLPNAPEGRWYSVNAAPIPIPGDAVLGSVTVFHDVTARIQLEQYLTELSIIDELTGLYNRRGLMLVGDQQMKAATRNRCQMIMLFADMDGFKKINDDLGHETGDRALKDTAALLRKFFRESDILCRLGGDEFVMLGFAQANVATLRERLYFAVDTYNATAGRPYRLGISVGVTLLDPAQPRTLAELLASSDELMREEKRRRKEIGGGQVDQRGH